MEPNDLFKRDNMPHRQWYEDRFKEEIANGIMELRQGMSWDCISEFPDKYFDYVYVDAGHDYQSIKKDIDALSSKVKNGCFIQFNDYCIGGPFTQPYGIIRAVNSFVNSGTHLVKYFCLNREQYLIGTFDIVIQLQN